MCGLVAKFSANQPVDYSVFAAAVDSLKYRGPDDSGIWQSVDKKVALGHTRLALRGIDSGAQPMVSNSAQCALVVNGELYDYQYLKQKLSAKGYCFQTDSDSELALHLYQEYGIGFTEYLRGEFALVLWDARLERLIAVRDRFGIKPLVYASTNGQITLASQSKALFALGHQAKWDELSVLHSFSHQYLPPQRTLFDGIYQLPPGHILLFQKGQLDIQSYWQAPLASDEENLDANALAALLEDAIEQRLQADVTPAFSLSGGIDSSLIVAMAAQKMAVKPSCFNIAFFDQAYDESTKAQAFANAIGAEFHEIRVSADDLVQHCSAAAYYSEGLGINGQYVGKYLLSRAVNAAGFKFMLSGEGADEAFFGYGHLQHDYYAHHPSAQSDDMLTALGQAFPLQSGIMMSADETAHGNNYSYLPAFLKTKFSMTKKLLPLLRQPYSDGHFRQDCLDKLMTPFAQNPRYVRATAVEKSAQLWTQLAMTGYILNTLGDGMEMAHSIEGRLPFLDHRLFEAAQRLPLTHKFKGLEAKHALRLLAKKYLPSALVQRPKHPFLAPPILGSLSHLGREAVYDVLDTQVLKNNPFVDDNKVHDWLGQIFTVPKEQQAAADPCLMMLLSLASIQTAFSLT